MSSKRTDRAVAHVVAVERESQFKFRATCSCGWSSAWTYAAAHAAHILAEDHANTASEK